MGKRTIILLLLFIHFKLWTQQVPTFSQYRDNLFVLNPAAAGAFGITSINLATRHQWVGFEGAPGANTLSFEGRNLKKTVTERNKSNSNKAHGKVGQGFLVFSDRSGLIRRTGIQYSYAYHVLVGSTQISGGLSAQIFQVGINKSKAAGYNEYDPLLFTNGNIWVPDFNMGVFVTRRAFFAGISANSLSQSAMKLGNNDPQNYQLKRFYYVVTGYAFAKNLYTIEPSVLYKTTGRQGNQLDFSTRVTYDNTFWIGAGARTNGDIIALIGVRVYQLFVGYAFDYVTGTFKLNNYGTHEVSISYKFGNVLKKSRWSERY